MIAATLANKVKPWNIGIIDHDFNEPVLENWPTANSKNTNGVPSNRRNATYGIKKAPL